MEGGKKGWVGVGDWFTGILLGGSSELALRLTCVHPIPRNPPEKWTSAA